MNTATKPCWRYLFSLALGLTLLFTSRAAAETKPKPAAAEPSNADEAAKKKSAEDAVVSEKFAAWKGSLPPAQQAWESVLEANLGTFYLPLYKRDKIAKRPTAWDYVADDPKLPRVLLIGDSISRGYTLATRKELAGRVNVHRAPENCGPTANALKKLDIWLGDGKWDVIHFNFGIHDRNTPIADYERRLEELVVRLQKTGAKVVWASTTPVPPDTKDGDKMPAAITERNAVAARIMAKHGIVIDDLFAAIEPYLAQTQNPKDVHFNEKGYDLIGKQVASSIESVLNKK